MAAARPGPAEGSLVVDLGYPDTEVGAAFSRAVLVFGGVDHSAASYEVRIFLNRPEAGFATPRTPDNGYAGRFHVLGHGGCFGDIGHCEITNHSSDPTDLRPPHPLTLMTTYVTITDALRQLLSGGGRLDTLTLVPVSVTPRRRDRRPAPELFIFDGVELRVYQADDVLDLRP